MQGYHLLPSEKGVCIYFTNAFLYNRPWLCNSLDGYFFSCF
jgi:hypothetical protein